MDIAKKMIGKKISPRCFDKLMYNADLVLSDEVVGE